MWLLPLPLPLLLLVACATRDRQWTPCQWSFQHCVDVGTSPWRRECHAVFRLVTADKRPCIASPSERRVSLASPAAANITHHCAHEPWCSVRPVWCAWGPWSEPVAECGEAAGRRRRRRRLCCHPVTHRPHAKVACSRGVFADATQEEAMQWQPCVESEPTRPGSSHLMNVAIGGFSVFFVIAFLAFVACRIYAHQQRHQDRTGSATQQAASTRPAPGPPPPARPRTPQPAPALSPPPPTRALVELSNPPPSYAEAQGDRVDAGGVPSSPPPNYELALREALFAR